MQLQTAGISIDRRLRGIVTIGVAPPGGRVLPDEKTWIDILRRLIREPGSLPGFEMLKCSGANQVYRATLVHWSEGREKKLDVVCKGGVGSGGLWASNKKASVARPPSAGLHGGRPAFHILLERVWRVVFRSRARKEAVTRRAETAPSRSRLCSGEPFPNTLLEALREIADRFRASRARRNFLLSLRLLDAGVVTPIPLAAIDGTRPRASWFVTEHLADLVDLDRLALAELGRLPGGQRRKAKDAIIAATADLFARLARGGFSHRDLKASNILLEGWGCPGVRSRAVLVDLDGLSGLGVGARGKWQPVVRLGASLLEYPQVTRSDWARFLRAYLRALGDESGWREHVGRVSRQALRYARRSRARKWHKLDGYT